MDGFPVVLVVGKNWIRSVLPKGKDDTDRCSCLDSRERPEHDELRYLVLVQLIRAVT